MPLARVNGIVINLVGCAEGQSIVGAAREHHVGGAASWRHYARQHVNVVVSGTTGAINRQEQHSGKSTWIDSPAKNEVAAHVHRGYPVKSRCLVPNLRIARTDAVKGVAFSADKNIAVRVHIECPVHRAIGNGNWTLPGNAAVGRALELHAAAATVNAVVCLVLKPVPRAVGLIDGEPFLIAAARALFTREQRPGLTAVCRAPEVIAEK